MKRKTDPRLSPNEAGQRDAVYEDDDDGIEGLSVLELILMVDYGLYLLVVEFVRGITRRTSTMRPLVIAGTLVLMFAASVFAQTSVTAQEIGDFTYYGGKTVGARPPIG